MACENDARDMEAIARSQGFVTQSLLTRSATSTSLLGIIEKAAKELVEGDIFLLTYSGHGGQINDVDNQEPDGLDETWVLYDRELVDDELYAMWSLFRPGGSYLRIVRQLPQRDHDKGDVPESWPVLAASGGQGARKHAGEPQAQVSAS